MTTLTERCSVLVVMRDRLSKTARCLEAILANTPEPYDLLVLLSRVSPSLRKELEGRFGHKARFFFEDRYYNQAESRNFLLRQAKTRLAAILDNDVYVRPGWLPPLVDCLNEKKAALVVPLVLEEPTLIHTAGNELFFTYKNGHRLTQKVLRYAKIVYFEGCDLPRSPVDYGELHCELMPVDVALREQIFDERLHEHTEIDSGLILGKKGYPMWFEPASVVHFDLPARITDAVDVPSFIEKWDPQKIHKSNAVFNQKWDWDIEEGGNWELFVHFFNQKLGLCSRLFPSRFSMAIDNGYVEFKRLAGSPLGLWRALKRSATGLHRWKSSRA